MTDNRQPTTFGVNSFFNGLYLGCGLISLTASGGALIFSDDFTVAVGILLGSVLGIAPFVSWHLIVQLTSGFSRKDRIPAAVAIGLGKYALLGGALYWLFGRNWVNPWALLGGMTAVLPVLVITALRPANLELEKKSNAGGEGPAR
jgi:hypothetical protein